MTISNPTNLATLTGNGVTTTFPYTFLIPDADSVEVTLLEIATNVEGDPLDPSLYTISGTGDPAGGEVEYPLVGSPLAATHKINIRRVVAYEQGLSLTAQSGYDPEALEDQLDKIVMQVQQLAEETSRGITIPPGSSTTADDLIMTLLAAESDAEAAAAAAAASEAAAAASAALAATFNPANYQPIDADLTAIAALATAAYGRSLLTAADASSALTLLGLSTVADNLFLHGNVGGL